MNPGATKWLGVAVAGILIVLALVYAHEKTQTSIVPSGNATSTQTGGNPVACTMEAKLCPDGTYVGRTGPNCEFAACPSPEPVTTGTGTVAGRVTISPTCPVERIPPDPQCAPRPFLGSVDALNTQGSIVTSKPTDADGNFIFTLPAGNYEIRANGGNPYPRCSPETTTVVAGVTFTVNISCDSGIR